MMSGQVWGTVSSTGGWVLEGKQNNSKQIFFFQDRLEQFGKVARYIAKGMLSVGFCFSF